MQKMKDFKGHLVRPQGFGANSPTNVFVSYDVTALLSISSNTSPQISVHKQQEVLDLQDSFGFKETIAMPLWVRVTVSESLVHT